jgi:hypothetical protein
MSGLIHRRGLLIGLGALFAAPAIVRASSLMPVKAIEMPLWGESPMMEATRLLQELGTFGNATIWIDVDRLTPGLINMLHVPTEWLHRWRAS